VVRVVRKGARSLLHFLHERGAIEAEQLGCAILDAASGLQRTLDQVVLERFD
jgi:hypothetical protein